MRVTIACLLVSICLTAQETRVTPLSGSDEFALARALDEAVRRRRPSDPWIQWSGHFLRGANGRTYVPYTLRIERGSDAFQSINLSVRVVGWNYVFADSLVAETERDGDARIFRGALLLQPGRCTVYVALQDRGGRSSRVALGDKVLVVPGFNKGLRLSSVIVVDRVERFTQSPESVDHRRHPYALGSVMLFPVHKNEFTRDDALTVAFQIYNAATFEDGRPDVEVHYRVFRKDGDRKSVGATAPQLFDQESLPEEFSVKSGHQLTPVQSLPLSQFEPGAYRLQISVEDHLGRAKTEADVPFVIRP